MKNHRFIERTLRGFARVLSHSLTAEELGKERGLLQALDPRVRVIGVFSLVGAITLARRLEVVLALFLLAVLISLASRIPISLLGKRVWLVILGFTGVIAVPALFLTPGVAVARIGGVAVTASGLHTALLLIARVESAVTLTVTLVLCTGWTHVLKALRALWVPPEVITMLVMTHRYVFLLIETANRMFESRQSRIVGVLSGREERQLAARTAGVLLSKTIDLSGEVYLAMQSRGFTGEVHLLDEFRLRWIDGAGLACFILPAIAAVWKGM